MAYISSTANRWYCALESSYGNIPAITAANRIPAVSMTAQQQRDKSTRKDKTGSRTFAGLPTGMRRNTSLQLTSYMRDWADPTQLPAHGPIVQAAMGGTPVLWPGGTPGTNSTTSLIVFGAPHNLTKGSAVASGGEIRFVHDVPDPMSVTLNAPFTTAPVPALALSPVATFPLAPSLPSISVFDYWDPTTAVQRVMTGVGIDQMAIKLNGDFHSFEFRGMAQDIIDSASFVGTMGGMTAFPAEPAVAGNTYSPVPGNLGQVWIGTTPNQMLTVSDASIVLRNNVETRGAEYGYSLPQAIVPGTREITMSLELFAQNDAVSAGLYQAARTNMPVSVMFQLGQVPGQLVGIWLKSLVPEIPQFDDSTNRLKWKFGESRAQGSAEDEIVVAFA